MIKLNFLTKKPAKLVCLTLVVGALMSGPSTTEAYGFKDYCGNEFGYHVKKGDTLSGISKEWYGTANYWDELATYNNISNPSVIQIGQIILIPTLEVIEDIDSNNYNNHNNQEYVVVKNDTLSGIAKKYYGSIDYYKKLAIYNHISNPRLIKVGQVIELPPLAVLKQVKENTNNNHNNNQNDVTYGKYTIKNGDSWYSLSKKFYNNSTYYKLLMKYNNRTTSFLRNGEVVYIPSFNNLSIFGNGLVIDEASEDVMNNLLCTYTVEPKDTLRTISYKIYGTVDGWDDIKSFNGLPNNTIYLGQKLYIPDLGLGNKLDHDEYVIKH